MAASIANSFGLELDDLNLQEQKAATYDTAALAAPLSPQDLGNAEGGSTGPNMPSFPFRNEGLGLPVGGSNLAGKLVRTFWGSPKRKTATTSGSALGIVGTGLILFLITSSGPFSIINLGEILQKQFAHTEFAGQTRMGRIHCNRATDTDFSYLRMREATLTRARGGPDTL